MPQLLRSAFAHDLSPPAHAPVSHRGRCVHSLLVWRETLAQHFDTVSGLYPGWFSHAHACAVAINATHVRWRTAAINRHVSAIGVPCA